MRQVQNAFLRNDIHTSLIVGVSSPHFFHVKKRFQLYQLSMRHASSMTLIQTKTTERHSPLGFGFYELLSLVSGFEKPTNKKEGGNPKTKIGCFCKTGCHVGNKRKCDGPETKSVTNIRKILKHNVYSFVNET